MGLRCPEVGMLFSWSDTGWEGKREGGKGKEQRKRRGTREESEEALYL